jgi:5-methyltetrahydrofolate--homocysteine methyltransferase
MNFRPKLSLLKNEDVERIIAGAFDLLATTGVMIKHEEALRILSDHGASVDFSTQVATMPMMQETIAAITENGLRDTIKILVGGAPLSQEFADRIGADGYGADAGSAAKLAKTVVS